MNTLKALRTFVALAHEGSIAAAAEKVSLTQAAVSQQMIALESELRRSLFDRSGRITRLNAAGRALLPQAERMLRLNDEMHGMFGDSEGLTGSYRLGAVVSACGQLAHATGDLRRQHPRIDIKLVAAKSQDLAIQVEAGELDAAVVVKPATDPAPPLAWTTLYEEPLIVLASARSHHDDALAALETEPFLRFDRRERTGELVMQTLRRHDFAVKEFLELNSIAAIADLVRQGYGVSLLPQLARGRWAEDKMLRVLPLPGATSYRELGLLHRANDQGPIIDAVVACLSDRTTAPASGNHGLD
ncbi:MAG: LysR family transcriptional regulator [Bradyrhizobium sp.]|uniref:LysR family transcriptional regulator n=1 Tax=Bradyrhizobium sp. TaxID=376 RepID=UPI003D0DD544